MANVVRVTRPPMFRRIALLALALVVTLTSCSNGYRNLTNVHATQVGATVMSIRVIRRRCATAATCAWRWGCSRTTSTG